ncbi:MAG: protein kinase, partial [Acidobacteria bacterium]|nr:protein kinase [Acidobacteriota bacterium]
MIGTRVSHYRILEWLGEGGMGEVYVALDETLQRKVALKVLRPDRILGPLTKVRFLREARILSSLDHVHICRIHDYIEENGKAFLVLELIEGRDLRGLIADGVDRVRAYDIAAQVTDVLVAAHEKGIVHRDLKPANVMLAAGGVVKVLDFGLARTEEPASIPSPHGPVAEDWSSAGTPPPGPPRGRPNDDVATTRPSSTPDATTIDVPLAPPSPHGLYAAAPTSSETVHGTILGTLHYMSPEQARGEPSTTATDMYSLGLLLQEVFTGRPVHDRSLDAETVMRRAASGRTADPVGLDRDLTVLIRRLKSPAPASRPTAVETAARLRWIRQKPRRRLRAAAIAVAVFAILTAGVKYTLDLHREQAIAIAARQDADRRRGQAEDLIHFMLGDLREKLTPVGRLEILDDVGDKALEYFAAIPESDLSEAEIFRRSQALNQIGDVRMAQGNLAAAMEAFQESAALAEQVVARDPANTEWLAGLGASHFWVGNVHWEQGDTEGALSRFEKYLAVAERLVEIEPDNAGSRVELAYAQANIGAVLKASGDLSGAAGRFEDVVDTWSALIDDDPGNVDWQRGLADNLSWLGSVQRARGRLGEAIRHFDRELEIRRDLVSGDPRNSEWQILLAIAHSHAGWIRLLAGELEEAEEHLGRYAALSASLVDRDSANLEWRRERGNSHLRLGELEVAAGDLSDVETHLLAAIADFDALVTAEPSNVDWQRRLAEIHLTLGDLLVESGRTGEASEAVERAADILASISASAEQPAQRVLAARTQRLLGDLLREENRPDASRSCYISGLDLIETVARDSQDTLYLVPWARLLMRLDRREEAAAILHALRDIGYGQPWLRAA